ncbi:hypothetical protein KOW79_020380, partial [Hemibagrus wyckioides]
EKQSRLVRHFHFHGWPEIGISSDGKGMIILIAAVQKQQQQSGNPPIVVHCSAGAGRIGTFIALVLERVKAEGLLDVKSLRTQRPHMVQTVGKELLKEKRRKDSCFSKNKSAGAGRTGTFIALVLERVKAEGLLDVKSLRTQRPHMVQTVEQYDFCYKVVQDFVDIFSDDANFK